MEGWRLVRSFSQCSFVDSFACVDLIPLRYAWEGTKSEGLGPWEACENRASFARCA